MSGAATGCARISAISEQRCTCGTVLSRFNKAKLCAVCARKDAAARLPVEKRTDPPAPVGAAAVRRRPSKPVPVKRSPAPGAILCTTCWKGGHPRRPYGFATCPCPSASCACGFA